MQIVSDIAGIEQHIPAQRIGASYGTTGKPIVVAYTQEDLDVWTNVMVRTLAACGLDHGDVVQNAYGYGLFTGGLGAHYGAEGAGRDRDPDLGRQHRPADHGDEGFRGHGHLLHAELLPPPARARRRAGRRSPRPAAARRRLRRRAVDRLDAPPHRSARAASGRLRHLRAVRDHRARAWRSSAAARTACTFSRTISIPEIIDPETGEPLPDGAKGELVLTTLEQAGHADDPLPHARHHRASSRSPAPAAARCAASAASPGAATTCSSSAA